MSAEIEMVPLEDALDRHLASLTQQQLAALRGEVSAVGGRAPERKAEGHSRKTLHVICRFGRSLRRLVKKT